MKLKLYIIIISILFIFLNGCQNEKILKKEQVEKIINENLKSGDPENRIINFLDAQKWLYEFDSCQKRYQILCPNCEKKRYILTARQIYIYIYIDTENSNSFKYAEVLHIYTSF